MATEIKMPQLSDTMSSGKILSWKKREGEKVSRGDILAEVETDKANLEIESFQNGVLIKVLIPADSVAKVGEVIAVIGAEGETYAGASQNHSQALTAQTQSQQPATTTNAPTANLSGPTANLSTPAAPSNIPSTVPPATFSPSPVAPLSVVTGSSSSRIKASPLAKKVAEQHQVNLSGLHGSGPNGRIVRRDVEAAMVHGTPSSGLTQPSGAAHAARALPEREVYQPPAARTVGEFGGSLTPLSKMRDTIARRMQESVTTAPHFYVTASVNMGQALKLREVLKERAEFKGISVNHLVIKAVAYGLSKEPRVNNAIKEGQLFEPNQINIGIITALEEGLIIPVLKQVDTMSLRDVVFEARAAIERARAGRPTSSDLSGGTFSISNMGMFDVENFTAIINPGQGGILAVSAVKETPVIENAMVVPGSVMKATVSVDHRIIDGVMASTFLKHFKDALEIPALLMT